MENKRTPLDERSLEELLTEAASRESHLADFYGNMTNTPGTEAGDFLRYLQREHRFHALRLRTIARETEENRELSIPMVG